MPSVPGMLTIAPGAAARATMSGTGPDEATSCSVLTPRITGACVAALSHVNSSFTSVGRIV